MATYPFVKINFRLVSPDSKPMKFANISAELTPKITNSLYLNTVIPQIVKTQTNQYGLASMILTANDILEMPNSKYLITMNYHGNSYYFLIELSKDTPEVVDFEDLLDRENLSRLERCKTNAEGAYKLEGNKLYL